MPKVQERKLAAIMFVDIVGYSRMMAFNEERTLSILKDFENIGSSIVKENDGLIIKKIGDELFCEFSSAKHAVDAALSIQNSLQSYNDSRSKDFKLQVRIGIHLGDIVKKDADVFGDGVNVASRISPFAAPGGICISNAVKDSISSHPHYNIKSEGQQELKNILEKHTLFRVETGFEDKIRLKNKIFKSSILKYFGVALLILFIIAGYYGYNIYNNYKILLNSDIDNQDEYVFLYDKIISKDAAISIEVLKSKRIFAELFELDLQNYDFEIIPDSSLSNLYDETVSYIHNKIPTSVKFLNKNSIKKDFESIGKQVPMYDFRMEKDFFSKTHLKPFEQMSNNLDHTTNAMMFETGADIASFVLLLYVSNINEYACLMINKKIEGDEEDIENAGLTMIGLMLSEDSLVEEIGDEIVAYILEVVNENVKEFEAEVLNINQDEILFKFDNLLSKTIDKNYVLTISRTYTDIETYKNDIIEYENSLISASDTSSKWYKDFYNKDDITWSKQKLEDLNSGKYFMDSDGEFIPFILAPRNYINLKITDIYDSTGVALIYKRNNPYIKIKIGDKLILKD